PVPGGDGARPQPSWLASALACVLIFTIVVDILGNLLVILSVYRNKKLRNAGCQHEDTGCGIRRRCIQLSLQSQDKPAPTHYWLNLTNRYSFVFCFLKCI
ncbi:T0111385 isoform 1, partial [Pan troglodytes]